MAMDCLKCEWRDKPADVRRDQCIACSVKFTKNSKVRWGTNELSNKGQTIESYDGRVDMKDDREIVSELHPDYVRARRKSQFKTDADEALEISNKTKVPVSEVGFGYVRRFLYELTSLTDHQICLLRDIVVGVDKSEFARVHGLTPSAVNRLYQMMIDKSPIIRNFIILSHGTVLGTRGRKRTRERKVRHRNTISHSAGFIEAVQQVMCF